MDSSQPPAPALKQGPIDAEDGWREPVARLLARLDTTAAGLDAASAQQRLAQYGLNDAATEKRRPLALQFLARFRNPLIIILLIASGMSAATGDVASFVIIAVIVLLSISLDFVQEVRAQSAVAALRRSVAVRASGRRDGHAISLPIDQLVPGDIAEQIAGDLVPADGRLLESRDLYVNQALLTGEPYPAEKRVSDTASGAENPTGASNTVFAGTSVISGTAVMLVCRTGASTALGHLATGLSEKPPATAFAVGIRRFGILILRFTIFMVLFVLVVNLLLHRPLLASVMFAVALAVGLTAGAVMFHTGWFIASLTAQILVVFSIRTRRWFFRSRPHVFLIAAVACTTTVAIVLPLLPIGHWFGFAPPPPAYFLYVIGATAAYLAVVEFMKAVFYPKASSETLPSGKIA